MKKYFIVSLLGLITLMFLACDNETHYSITYHTNGGDILTNENVLSGETVSLKIPSKVGHTFLGWYSDADYRHQVDTTIRMNTDLDLYAKWEKNLNKITFISPFNDKISDLVYYGEPIDFPSFSHQDYDLSGWLEAGTIFLDSTMPARDLTLNAVFEPNYTLPSGYYNLNDFDLETRYHFLAAAEKYLLTTFNGGIPLIESTHQVFFSDRVELLHENYLPYVGYSEEAILLHRDDAETFAEGTINHFTFREALIGSINNFNPYQLDLAHDSKIIYDYTDSFYTFKANESFTGVKIVPSLASSLPTPVNANHDIVPIKDTTWQVIIKDNLRFKMHPNTLSQVELDPLDYDLTITVDDFLDTYQLVMDEAFFQAINGENHLLRIKNMQGYIDGTASFNEVGLRKINDYTIEFEFTESYTLSEVLAVLSSPYFSPLHKAFYNDLKTMNIPYGSVPEALVSVGPFYIDKVSSEEISLIKNDNYHEDLVQFTHKTYRLVNDESEIKNLYLTGHLDRAYFTQERIDIEGINPYHIPKNYIFRLNLNTNQDPLNNAKISEPILSEDSFKRAMYYAIDRDYIARDVYSNAKAMPYFITDQVILDLEEGTVYRHHPISHEATSHLRVPSRAYQESLATNYYLKTIETLIAKGIYSKGTITNQTVIPIELVISESSEEEHAIARHIKDTFERLFIDSHHHVVIRIDIIEVPYPLNYMNHLLTGDFEMALGGVSINNTNPTSLLTPYLSSNPTGFTMNYGFDTNDPVITVYYKNPMTGEVLKEKWSFEAITVAFSGTVLLEEGKLIND